VGCFGGRSGGCCWVAGGGFAVSRGRDVVGVSCRIVPLSITRRSDNLICLLFSDRLLGDLYAPRLRVKWTGQTKLKPFSSFRVDCRLPFSRNKTR